MRQISVRDLRKNLAAELKNLPFIITSRADKVAMCTQIRTESGVHNDSSVHKPKGDPSPKIEAAKKISDHPGLCKHGSAKGLCRLGCK